MWSTIFPDHPLWLLQKNARLLGMFHFLSALSLRMAALNRGVQIFSSKKPTKFVPFRQILQRCQTKNEPFGLHFAKSTDKNLRVRIPVTFGGADKKWNVPYGLPLFKAVFTKAPYTNKGMIKENRSLKINLEGRKRTSSGRNPTARGFFNLL